jgi:hypothetical protein
VLILSVNSVAMNSSTFVCANTQMCVKFGLCMPKFGELKVVQFVDDSKPTQKTLIENAHNGQWV